MSNNPRLIGDRYSDFRIFVEDNTLAGQAALQARIDSAIDEIFFLVGDFFEVIVAFFHVNMTGRAGTNAAAVMIQVHIGIFCDFKNGLSLELARHFFGGNT